MQPIALGRGRSLYILPTREGFTYVAVLLVTLLAAINYANGLAYALTFLLAAIGIVATLHTHRNLAGLRLSDGPVTPVFAGDAAVFRAVLQNDSNVHRHAIELYTTEETFRVEVAAHASTVVEIPITATRRGYLSMPSVALRTVFPLGLWRTWSRTFTLDARCLIYPHPGDAQPLPETPGEQPSQQTQGATSDGDDFAGLREFRPGDSVQRVAWKKAVVDGTWYTKQFATPVAPLVWLTWEGLPATSTEQRLSLLCRWVLMADAGGVLYGMRLPQLTIQPGRGATHRDQCLKCLALYQAPV